MNPSLTVKEPKPKLGGGGRPPLDRSRGGWGEGDGHGDGAPDYGERLRRYRLGLAVGLTSVVMLFVSFTSAYIVRQGLGSWDQATGAYVHDWQRLHLPMALLVLNSAVLLASSFSVEMARRAAARQLALAPVTAMPGISEGREKPVPWLTLTLVLGFGFLLGQFLAWHSLQSQGMFLATGPSSSFFYVLTGAHALHLAGGLIALLYAAAIATPLFSKRRFGTQVPAAGQLERRRIVVDIAAWYWHVLALLWIYIFALLALAG